MLAIRNWPFKGLYFKGNCGVINLEMLERKRELKKCDSPPPPFQQQKREIPDSLKGEKEKEREGASKQEDLQARWQREGKPRELIALSFLFLYSPRPAYKLLLQGLSALDSSFQSPPYSSGEGGEEGEREQSGSQQSNKHQVALKCSLPKK